MARRTKPTSASQQKPPLQSRDRVSKPADAATPSKPEADLPDGLRLEWMDPAALPDNPNNYRTHPDSQTKALVAAIKEVGWAGALLYNEHTGRLIDGHARKKMPNVGEKVPVLVGSWTEEQEKVILATLDPLAGMAEIDQPALDKLIASISVDDPDLKRMFDELQTAVPTAIVEDEAPHRPGRRAAEEMANRRRPTLGNPEHDGPASKGRDLPKLQAQKPGAALKMTCQCCGEEFDGQSVEAPAVHKLLVADSTVVANVERVMGGEKAGLCFTSPPYEQQRDYEAKIGDWLQLMKGVFASLPMAEDGQVLVNLGLIHREGECVPYWEPWIEWMRHQGWRRFGWYVWDQGPGMPGDWAGRLAPSFEFIFHFNKASVHPIKARDCIHAGQKHGGKGQRDARGHVKPRHHGTAAVQPTAILDSVIRVNRQGAAHDAEGHPAPFPVGLPGAAMRSWGGLCYEPFGGSGTTWSCGEQLGRSVYGMEVEAKYAAICLERLSVLGLEPVLCA